VKRGKAPANSCQTERASPDPVTREVDDFRFLGGCLWGEGDQVRISVYVLGARDGVWGGVNGPPGRRMGRKCTTGGEGRSADTREPRDGKTSRPKATQTSNSEKKGDGRLVL